MKWQVILQKIEIRGFNPETSGKNKIARKNAFRIRLKNKIGKNLTKVQQKSRRYPLLIDVCFYLYHSDESGRSKKDLDNLLKILFDVLSDNMVNGQVPKKGLSIMTDDSFVYKIKCEKKLVNSESREGLDLMISRYG